MRTRILAIMTVLLIAVVACGAPKRGNFTPIAPGNIPASLTATTSTTTTTTTTLPSTTTTIEAASTTTFVEPPPTTIPTELFRLFFIAGRNQISPIDVPLARGASAAQVMAVLEVGPTGGAAEGLRSAIPPGSESSLREDRGLVTVDLPTDFFTENEDNPADQRLAVAQIVLTLTQLGGISQVKFTQSGDPISVFLGDGSVSEADQPLFEDDYAALLTSNPPVSTTTTLPAETTTSAAAPESTG